MTAAFPIVGLGAYGTTVVAGTEGYPYVASGNAPESMVEEKIEVNLPCVNGRGLVDLGYSVAYPSNDGLVVVSNGGATVATDALFTRPAWQKLSPETFIAGQFAGRYFASYSYTATDGTISSGTEIIDLTGQQPFTLRGSVKADAFYYDLPTGTLFYAVGGSIFEWDALGQVNDIMSWRSKHFVMPAPISFGAILVEGKGDLNSEQQQAETDANNAIAASNATILALASMGSEMNASAVNEFGMNEDPIESIEPAKYISVSVYADGRLVRVVNELNTIKRIKGDRRAKVWEIHVSGTAEVEQITIAGTVRELNEI